MVPDTSTMVIIEMSLYLIPCLSNSWFQNYRFQNTGSSVSILHRLAFDLGPVTRVHSDNMIYGEFYKHKNEGMRNPDSMALQTRVSKFSGSLSVCGDRGRPRISLLKLFKPELQSLPSP